MLITDYPGNPTGHPIAYPHNPDRRLEPDDGFTDWRGQRLNVGDRVVYSTRHGSSMRLVEGTILEKKVAEVGYRKLKEPRLVIQAHFEGGGWRRRDVRGGKNRQVSLKYVTKVEA